MACSIYKPVEYLDSLHNAPCNIDYFYAMGSSTYYCPHTTYSSPLLQRPLSIQHPQINLR